ncbi:MAG: hypothetical protein KGI97_08115 [Alphaproteobacteria bacterium]|nr:hypothetical protein [Alphaproteobacteria bacterium]
MFVIHSPHFLPPKGHRARKLALAFLILAPFAIGLLALALGQDINWDFRNYHFYNAYAFLHDRYGRDMLAAQIPSFYNPLLDVPFFWLATHVPARAAGFALGFVQGLNFILLFGIAHAVLTVPNPRHKVIVCAALAALGVLGGEGISLIGTTFGDNITSLGILLSAALIVRHMERLSIGKLAPAFGLAFAFGLPAGAMAGLKLPAALYCAGLCGGFAFAGGSLARRIALGLAFGLGVLVGMAVTLGPWAWFLQTRFGNPFFPYFNGFFHSPYAPSFNARDTQYAPHGWREFLFMPFMFAAHPQRVGEIAWRDWRIPILYVLLPLALVLRLFFGRNRKAQDAIAAPLPARYLLAGFTISYGVWLVLFTIYRYAVTLEMAAPLLIVLAAGMLPLKISTRGLIAAFLLAAVSASIHPGTWGRRQAWLDGPYVQAAIPKLGDMSNLMILMAGDEPYSHLIPEFPPQIPFVRIQSNFSDPWQPTGFNKLLHARIGAHRKKGGRFMMLIPPWQRADAIKALGYFGLKLAPEPCKAVTDRLYNDIKMNLCDVGNAL